MFHWTPRRIEAHVRLCVLALQMQRAAEIRCARPWSQIATARRPEGDALPRRESDYCSAHEDRRQPRATILKKLGVSMPKQILSISEPSTGTAAP